MHVCKVTHVLASSTSYYSNSVMKDLTEIHTLDVITIACMAKANKLKLA